MGSNETPSSNESSLLLLHAFFQSKKPFTTRGRYEEDWEEAGGINRTIIV